MTAKLAPCCRATIEIYVAHAAPEYLGRWGVALCCQGCAARLERGAKSPYLWKQASE